MVFLEIEKFWLGKLLVAFFSSLKHQIDKVHVLAVFQNFQASLNISILMISLALQASSELTFYRSLPSHLSFHQPDKWEKKWPLRLPVVAAAEGKGLQWLLKIQFQESFFLFGAMPCLSPSWQKSQHFLRFSNVLCQNYLSSDSIAREVKALYVSLCRRPL